MAYDDALASWLRGLEHADDEALTAALDEQVVFQSPVANSPVTGRDVALKYLRAAREILVNEDFSYVGRWESETGVVLEFKTRVDGVEVNGVDILYGRDDGAAFRGVKVMLRPLKALETLRGRMVAKLSAG